MAARRGDYGLPRNAATGACKGTSRSQKCVDTLDSLLEVAHVGPVFAPYYLLAEDRTNSLYCPQVGR